MFSSKVIIILSLMSTASAVFQPFFDPLLNDYADYNSFPSQPEPKSLRLGDPVCRDETTGEPLDWFTLYKLPKSTQILETSRVSNPFIYDGTAYTYMTNLAQSEWSMSSLSMNDTNSFAGKTLDILYNTSFNTNQTGDNKLGYILYNDQADRVSLTRGHTKGVIIFNENAAIWVVHSIPHFPPKPSDSDYQIHSSQCVYGQQFFCMSIQPTELEKIGQQLLYTFPQVYDSYIPEFAKEAPHFKNLLKSVELLKPFTIIVEKI
jgi:deoxyribonuclease-2